jgi:hypothetical protein
VIMVIFHDCYANDDTNFADTNFDIVDKFDVGIVMFIKWGQ